MQRVLLINPPDTDQTGFSNPPLGLLYLAGTLLHHDIDVRVVDGCLDGRQAIVQAVAEYRPDLVGITCLTAGRHRALEVARAVKDEHPGLPVVLGGVHPTILPIQLMEHYPFVDFVVMGEGEQTLLELAQERPLAEIKGLVYRSGTEIKRNPPRPLVANLDDIPLPAWHLVDLHRYPAIDSGVFHGIDLAKEPRVSVIFSRGCVGHCSFCSTWWVWRGWRHRSAANMVDEIELLYREQGIRHFCFADDALTVDRQATLELCDEILTRHLDIAFFASTRADCVDETVLAKLKDAGCHRISFGVETASQSLLERMGKKTDVAAARRAIRLSKQAGLRTTALVIVGNEGETEETIEETIAFLRETGPDELGCVGGLWIFPGTRLYQNCKRQGYIDDGFWLGPEPYKLYELEHTAGEIGEYHHRVVNFGEVGSTPRRQLATGDSPRVSLVVNTLNAASYLDACLQSAADAVDEIVVVDMHSDDDTAEIALRHGARVLAYPRMGYVEPARNFAVEQATGDWILILDADERLTPALRDSLRGLVADPGGAEVFQVPYNTFIAGRWIQGTGWGRDREQHPRLFRKSAVRWADAIHAAPQIMGPEASLPLPAAAAIDHLNYASLQEFVERLNRYTGVEAADLASGGQTWTAEAMLRAARQELVDRYEPGVDGAHSLVLSVAMAFYRFLSLAKLWEQQGYPRDRLPASPQDLLAWLADPNTEVDWLESAQVPAAGDSPVAVATTAGGPAVEQPHQQAVRFARGFYRDEGGWRWMGPEGILVVAAQSLPASLSFDLTCAATASYRRFPFQVRILVDEEVRARVDFDASDQTRPVSLPIVGNTAGARIRLEATESFVPARLGLNPDQRRLSLRLGNLTLTREAPSPVETTPLAAWLARAAGADAAGDPAGAETVLHECLKQHPNAPEPYRQLALLLAARQDYPLADEMLRLALALAPADAALYNEYGTLCLLRADLPGAMAAYERALALDPALETARVNLATCVQGWRPEEG